MSPGEFRPCAIVPVYNHADPVVRVTHRLRSHGLVVILVDDGSDTACAKCLDRLAQEPGVFLERHLANRGKGGAVKTALRSSAARHFTHALQVDADGQHDLDDVPRMLAAAQATPDEMICGKPVFDDSIPTMRKLARYLTHGLVAINTLSGTLYDAMCGFRVYPVESVQNILTNERTGDRMDFDPEILVRWRWHGLRITTVPTKVRYPEDGQSHFRMVFDNLFITRMHARMFIGMLWRMPEILRRRWSGRAS